MNTTEPDELEELIEVLKALYNDVNGDDNETTVECTTKIDHYKFYQFSLIPAVVLTLLMAFSKHRTRLFKDFLQGRPGLVFPMDTLTRSSRISYCCAFGATGLLVYTIIIDQTFAIDYNGPIAIKALIVIVSMFIYGIVYFPIFTCLALRTAFSYALGSLYIWMFFGVEVFQAQECADSFDDRIVLLLRALPNLLCQAYLSISLPYRFVVACYRGNFFKVATKDHETLEDIKKSFQGRHVQSLLKKPEIIKSPVGAKNKIKNFLKDKVSTLLYHKDTGFRYPSRFISVLFIGGIVVYVITIELFQFAVAYVGQLAEFFDQPILSTRLVVKMIFVVYYALLVSISLACVLSYCTIFHMMSTFRKNLYAMYKGDYSDIPPPSTQGAISLCVGCIKYAGFQVGYIVWGYILSLIVFFLVSTILGLLITLLTNQVVDWLVNKVLQIWPGVLIAIAILIIQKLLARFVFLQGDGTHLRLDNRRLFFIFTYFMFFYNIFLGLVSCVLRIVKAIVIGTLFLCRLDNSTLPRKWESFDPGFNAYQGYIHTEAAHTNPTVNVFIRLLKSLSHHRKSSGRDSSVSMEMTDLGNYKPLETDGESVKYPALRLHSNPAARFNWLVTYTLILNPGVRIYRKGFIQSMKKAMQLGIKIPISDKPITDFDLVKLEEEREKELEEAEEEKKARKAKNDKHDNVSVLHNMWSRKRVSNLDSTKIV